MVRLLKLQGWVRHRDSPSSWSDVPEVESIRAQNKCCSPCMCVGLRKERKLTSLGLEEEMVILHRLSGIQRMGSEPLNQRSGSSLQKEPIRMGRKNASHAWWRCDFPDVMKKEPWDGTIILYCPHGLCVITRLFEAKEECSGVLRKLPLAAAGFGDDRQCGQLQKQGYRFFLYPSLESSPLRYTGAS